MFCNICQLKNLKNLFYDDDISFMLRIVARVKHFGKISKITLIIYNPKIFKMTSSNFDTCQLKIVKNEIRKKEFGNFCFLISFI